MTCDSCGHELQIGDYPFCPHPSGSNGVIRDEIPGGIMIEHGLCHPGGEPKRYDYKSDIYRDAKKKGLHVGAFMHGSPPGRTWV